MTGMGDGNISKKCLRPSEILKSEKRVLKLKDILLNTFIDPFGEELDHSKLFNIASGCPTSEEIEKCLLGIAERDKELHLEFDT